MLTPDGRIQGVPVSLKLKCQALRETLPGAQSSCPSQSELARNAARRTGWLLCGDLGLVDDLLATSANDMSPPQDAFDRPIGDRMLRWLLQSMETLQLGVGTHWRVVPPSPDLEEFCLFLSSLEDMERLALGLLVMESMDVRRAAWAAATPWQDLSHALDDALDAYARATGEDGKDDACSDLQARIA